MARAIAAIDVGSNAIRLEMVRLCPCGTLVDRESRRYSLGLGTEVYRLGRVEESTADVFIEVFGDIVQRMNKFGVQKKRAIATAALRDASNRAELTGRIYSHHAIHIDVISGAEESMLARTALIRALGFVDTDSLMLDLGGGSLELMGIGDGRGVSLPLGSIRILQDFPALRGPCSASDTLAAQQAVARIISRGGLKGQVERFVGTGGNLSVLARLLPLSHGMWPAVDLTRLAPLIERMRGLDTSARVKAFGVRRDRAKALLPVAILLAALRDQYAVDSIVVPETGVREAVLQSIASEPSSLSALCTLLERAGVQQTAAFDRARLAAGLFQLLAPVHRLWPSAIQALEMAAFGWELGHTVNPNDPVRHGAYLIRYASELNADEETRIVAAAAFRHSRGGRVYSSRVYSSTLNSEQRRATRVLGALLEVAARAAPGARPEDLRADLTGADHLWVGVGLEAQRRWRRLERALGRRFEIV